MKIGTVSLGLALLIALSVPSRSSAQSAVAGPGRFDVSLIPAGATFFMAKNGSPEFWNYTLGAAVTYNITPWIGVEGEVTGVLGLTQSLQFGAINGDVKTPEMAAYTGDVVVSLPTHSAFVPYAVGGIGALTVFDKVALRIASTDTLLTGNVGGGLRWYANRRWGLRGDYRFIATQSKDDASAFFGRDTRYGHRVYGALVVNILE